ncbi:hypothetical protein DFH06DRAFT_1432472 [Mycena polygramma]|nr:hypothetical protein DFH06DRAFT_1432472 [Mycena polygramma]
MKKKAYRSKEMNQRISALLKLGRRANDEILCKPVCNATMMVVAVTEAREDRAGTDSSRGRDVLSIATHRFSRPTERTGCFDPQPKRCCGAEIPVPEGSKVQVLPRSWNGPGCGMFDGGTMADEKKGVKASTKRTCFFGELAVRPNSAGFGDLRFSVTRSATQCLRLSAGHFGPFAWTAALSIGLNAGSIIDAQTCNCFPWNIRMTHTIKLGLDPIYLHMGPQPPRLRSIHCARRSTGQKYPLHYSAPPADTLARLELARGRITGEVNSPPPNSLGTKAGGIKKNTTNYSSRLLTLSLALARASLGSSSRGEERPGNSNPVAVKVM